MFRVFILFIFGLIFNAASAEDNQLRCYGLFHAKKPQEAVPYCQKSADSGQSTGKHLLGIIYLNGMGVTQDKERGIVLLRAAAEMGSSDAQKDYGIALQHGLGVKKDMASACDWWEKSAAQNNFLAQSYIAGCYLLGSGRAPDKIKAYAYLLLSSRGGYVEATEYLAQLRPEYNRNEIRASELAAAKLREQFSAHKDDVQLGSR